ncbi:hypothetical protein NliqN6_6631 [Naganishia liquefaciens]|uniref:Homeobox domain-containing protein n=1 Tax=Naganishia liquefaciens TaxID=104408 RepID=A0A8H3U1S4_9TREE|nr:hypothetical protein NliqN6_6631 [Naganishia liquefaciens]
MSSNDVSTSGPSTFAPPHAILTPKQSTLSQKSDSQHGSRAEGMAQSSSISAPPYVMGFREASGMDIQPASFAQGQSGASGFNVPPGHSQQSTSVAYVYSQSPLSQMSVPLDQTGTLYYTPSGVNAGQSDPAVMQQHQFLSGQKTSASSTPPSLTPGLSYQVGGTAIQPYYHPIQSLTKLPVAPGIISAERDSSGSSSQPHFTGQQIPRSLDSSSQPSPSLQPGMVQYRMAGSQVYTSLTHHPQYQPPSAQATMTPQAPTGIASMTWQPTATNQHNAPVGFSQSHSRNPGFSRGGIMISENVDQEEYVGNLTYDPYMVKHRKRTTTEQLAVLEKAFDDGAKPTASTRREIAEKIGMTPRSVQVWFQNRRQKKKMMAKKNSESESSHKQVRVQEVKSRPYTANVVVEQSGHLDHNTNAHFSTQSRKDLSEPPNQQNPLPYTKPGAIKPTPLISQVRRGSVPYPPPHSPSAGIFVMPQRPPPPPSLSRAVSSSALARAQIPSCLASDSSPNRRASLPVNSHSISLGFFTPPRIGTKAATGALSAITDDEHLLGSNVSEHASHSAFAGAPLSVATEPQGQPYGPLPNPEFSFGNTTRVDRKASLTSSTSGSPHITSPMVTQGLAYRNRMGSMASTFSQATTTDGTSDSDWERTQQLVTPYTPTSVMQVYSDIPAEMVEVGANVNNKQLLVPVYNDFRRASAPAELLQKFAVLDVEHQLAHHPSRKNRSPLTMSYTEVNEESDGCANGSTASPENRPRQTETHSSVA